MYTESGNSGERTVYTVSRQTEKGRDGKSQKQFEKDLNGSSVGAVQNAGGRNVGRRAGTQGAY